MAIDPRTDCEAPAFWRGGVVSCGRCPPCVTRRDNYAARAYRRAMGINHAEDDATSPEAVHPVPAGECRCECPACEYRGEHHADASGGNCQIDPTDTAIRTLEYEAGVRDQELADLRLRVVQLESAAGFVVRRAELATSESLRERIEALRKVLDSEDASKLSRSDGFRRFANELIDAIASPKGRDFRHAWDEACVFFGRFGAEPTLVNLLLRFAEATRLYVVDKDEDRVQTWDAMIDALDAALDAFPDASESDATPPISDSRKDGNG